MPCKIAIIGGGVNGLASGVRLQKAVPQIHVQIIAELTGDDTTSRGAGGLWKPFSLVEYCKHMLSQRLSYLRRSSNCIYALFTGDTPSTDVIKWGEATFQHMLKLFQSPAASAAGMQLVDAYQLWDVSFIINTC
jgi:phytoene dehydrogenase-like protein